MIRKATAEDVPFILEMERKYFRYPRLRIDVEDFYVDDLLRGYADMKTVIDEGYIGNVCVSEEFRRQGIADALIDKLMETDLSFITLEVRESNIPAINLYKKHGFVQEGILRNHYSDPKEDGLVMTVRNYL